MGFEIIEAGRVVSTILIRFSEFPRVLECVVRNKDVEGLEEAVQPHFPVREILPGGGTIFQVLKPARPERWRFVMMTVYHEADAIDLREAGLLEEAFEPEEPEHTVWMAFGLEHEKREEAVQRVKRTNTSNLLVRTHW